MQQFYSNQLHSISSFFWGGKTGQNQEVWSSPRQSCKHGSPNLVRRGVRYYSEERYAENECSTSHDISLERMLQTHENDVQFQARKNTNPKTPTLRTTEPKQSAVERGGVPSLRRTRRRRRPPIHRRHFRRRRQSLRRKPVQPRRPPIRRRHSPLSNPTRKVLCSCCSELFSFKLLFMDGFF